MFTSRAEYRLRLRADNADQRLTPKGLAAGCIGEERRRSFSEKERALGRAREMVNALRAGPGELAKHGLRISQDGVVRTAGELLAFPDVTIGALAAVWPELRSVAPEVAAQVEIDSRYAVYLARQEADIAAFRRDEAIGLPSELDYGSVSGLSGEVREKLEAVRPETLGAAARIQGMTPAALILLLRHLRRREGSHAVRERA
jgi:tRNA uridine 5-carboxymethylaminomethyl modification enzyme